MIIRIGEIEMVPLRVTWEEALTSDAKLREYIYQNTKSEIWYPFWEFPRRNPYLGVYAPILTKNAILKRYHEAKKLMSKGVFPSEIEDPYGSPDKKIQIDLPLFERLKYVLQVLMYRKQQIGKQIDYNRHALEWRERSLATKKHNKQYKAELEEGIAEARRFLRNPPPIKKRPEITWQKLLQDSALLPEYLYQHSFELHPLDDYDHPWHYWQSVDPLFSVHDLCPYEYLMEKYENAVKQIRLGVIADDIPDPVYEGYLQPDPEQEYNEGIYYREELERRREREVWEKTEKEKNRLANARMKLVFGLCAILDQKIASSEVKDKIQYFMPGQSVVSAKGKLEKFLKKPKSSHPDYKSYQIYLADVLTDEELMYSLLFFYANDCLRPLLWEVKICFPMKTFLDKDKRDRLLKKALK